MKQFSLEYLKETYNPIDLNDVFKVADDVCKYIKDEKYLKNKNYDEIKELLKNFTNFICYLGREKNNYFFITHSVIEKLYTKVYGKLKIDTIDDTCSNNRWYR